MRTTASVLTLILLLCSSCIAITMPDETDAWVLDKVNKNKDEFNITFGVAGGEDDSSFITLPAEAPVYNARIGVRGFPDGGGEYPGQLWMDVGHDGDIEWRFGGKGYGDLGKQTRFSDNKTSQVVPFHSNKENDTYSIYLPKGAVVTKATVDITGKSGVNDGAESVSFTTILGTGKRKLSAIFNDAAGQELGAYYLTVTRLEEGDASS